MKTQKTLFLSNIEFCRKQQKQTHSLFILSDFTVLDCNPSFVYVSKNTVQDLINDFQLKSRKSLKWKICEKARC